MDKNEISKYIDELEKENKRLQYIKGQYAEFAGKLLELAEQIKTVAHELDPVTKLRKISSQRRSHKEELEALYDKMKSGTLLTKKIIFAAYPESNPGTLWGSLKKMPRIHVGGAGHNKHLFFQE